NRLRCAQKSRSDATKGSPAQRCVVRQQNCQPERRTLSLPIEWRAVLAITFYDLVDRDGRRYSPYGWRVRMALAHKGLDAKAELTWHSDKKKLAFSGQHLVPVIRDGDKAVSD